ncbi:queuine trna-ribosyltransferase [Holotrichia oblita]|nr:queuine trna-ribosyltransferase [Holotrichia oblita]
MFDLINKSCSNGNGNGNARRGKLKTVHGDIETPFFMNVATSAAIKGGISAFDLKDLKCQVMLCNTYHLHLRPSDTVIKQLGGIRKFTGWNGPVLTDSGGFQVFSLAKLRKIKEEGVYFSSHIDGKKIFMGPEESMRIQSNLASTIVMAFDECVENPAPYDYVRDSAERTTRWLERCKAELEKLNAQNDTLNKNQLLFGINQGGTYDDLRSEHMKRIAELDLAGYAVGGLAVGEPVEVMYGVLDIVTPLMPINKPRYLMGVGTPSNIIEAVARGIDMFDCVMPSRNARHATVFTWRGITHMTNEKYMTDELPLDPECDCSTCQLVLIAAGLSMDAFAVSVSNGLCMKKVMLRKALTIAIAFGSFQAGMPLLGYLLGSRFTDFITRFDHYIALIFLSFIGGKMLVDGIKELRNPSERDESKELKIPQLLLQAVATSIDALIIGISFVAMGLDWSGVAAGVTLIGIITFGLSFIGVFAGKKFGELLGSRAVILGGVILVGIGRKQMKFLDIGYGNAINANRIVSIISADAAPSKRMITAAKERNSAVDATCGKKTKTIFVMDSGHIIMSAKDLDSITGQFKETEK